jgi:hypothetical protein
MVAGWYRYMSQWRLTDDGIIKPRFGLAAVENSCVCNRHHHHVYWRFDFDIKNAGSNRVFEHNNPPLSGGTDNWRPLNFEVRRPRNPAPQRRWRVQNTQSNEAYVIAPGPNDGWMRCSSAEIDNRGRTRSCPMPVRATNKTNRMTSPTFIKTLQAVVKA